MVSTEEPGTWEPLIETAERESEPTLSPDGRWLVYVSSETSRAEVYVRRFLELDDRRQVSVRSGYDPTWPADGGELVYVRATLGPPEAVMRVTIDIDEGDLVQVKPASVEWDADTRLLRFVIMEGDVEIPVESTGAPPQMFGDGMGVMVEGTYNEDGLFRSSSVMVKPSNEYAPPDEDHDPRETYKSLIEGES